ncbi:MBOAT family protein [Eubacterium sp. am_0171]|uniref:D-alanyl-lipoteichoic acid biosynthesis protein DltB n=1 Tax=Faecalicatena contorta TaxID=39482 RepID=A0A173ZW13_9FIRM|nr:MULTISPECIES: MBOAT family O-acyltransferase [Clostridia]MSC82750.1 MBOAT family protein [Eubacterium sp. BIOML-A1]MSD05144.1 MBOAT family protein [Eubacterium sp. BIOML-A2]RYT25039.1 MBOAT family protein [Eubacterium sp. am_0171]CUN79415.1 D-alanyl-lipoteichoic acid biosynthesis protein DltB [[Eubacterium] contortum] [Faecalicatena contorta]
MLFSSITFLFIFLPVTLALYFIVPHKFRNIIMLIASLIFYAWGEPVYIILMLLSILLNYVCGLDIYHKEEDPQKARRSLIFAVVCNLLLLGFFKYYGFVLDSLNAVLPVDIPYRELPLPIGISFYTFQALSYIIDVYRKEVRPQKNILYFAMYISMFPQLIAGPIVRYIDIEEQLKNRTVTMRKFGQGAEYFIIGLAKKVILANSVGQVFDQISGLQMGSFSVLTAWVGCVSFAFQIYFDFSGYSDMAVGLGKMFGFEFRRNFDYPYTSSSITEFWRRWHISLSTWFREYVYIPLGGNRCTQSRQIMNLLVVWMLTGLWHGSAWNLLFWGLYYGLLLVLEKFVWGKALERLPDVVRHIYSIVLVMIGWVFFFSPSLGYALRYLSAMFGAGASAFIDKQALYFILTHWLLYAVAVLGSSAAGYSLIRRFVGVFDDNRAKKTAAGIVYIGMFLISIAYLVTESFNPFLYFRF